MARILLAEDDDNVRAFVVRALEMAGHTVSFAEDGGLALEALLSGLASLEWTEPMKMIDPDPCAYI